jgi:hypothetical protein
LENQKGREQLENVGVELRIILQWDLREIGWEGVNWIHLAQDADK